MKELPKGWKRERLGLLSKKLQYGYTSKSQNNSNDNPLYLRTTDFSIRDLNWDKVPYCCSAVKDEKKYLIEEGDILITRAGSIGKNVLIDVKPPRAVFASYLIRVQPIKSKTTSKYLFYFFQSPFYWNAITQKKLGIAVPNVNATKLSSINIPYPESLEEQELIVEEIEKQLTRLENGVDSLKKVKNNLEVYKQSVLKSSFKGDYNYLELCKIFKTTSGGTPSRSNKLFYQGNVNWLKSGELNDNMELMESEEHITNEALKKSSAKLFPKNTVLIALYGATIGKLAILRNESSTNQAVCGILPNKDYLPEFLFYFLLFKRNSLINKGKGGAQSNISQGIVKQIKIPKIDKKEQEKIISKIEFNFSVIDAVETIVDKSLLKAESLKMSILKSAFEGKLVKGVKE